MGVVTYLCTVADFEHKYLVWRRWRLCNTLCSHGLSPRRCINIRVWASMFWLWIIPKKVSLTSLRYYSWSSSFERVPDRVWDISVQSQVFWWFRWYLQLTAFFNQKNFDSMITDLVLPLVLYMLERRQLGPQGCYLKWFFLSLAQRKSVKCWDTKINRLTSLQTFNGAFALHYSVDDYKW